MFISMVLYDMISGCGIGEDIFYILVDLALLYSFISLNYKVVELIHACKQESLHVHTNSGSEGL
jgi:hypothetical protein